MNLALLATPSEKTTLVSRLLLNAPASITFTLPGIVILVNILPVNALAPIYVTVFGIITLSLFPLHHPELPPHRRRVYKQPLRAVLQNQRQASL